MSCYLTSDLLFKPLNSAHVFNITVDLCKAWMFKHAIRKVSWPYLRYHILFSKNTNLEDRVVNYRYILHFPGKFEDILTCNIEYIRSLNNASMGPVIMYSFKYEKSAGLFLLYTNEFCYPHKLWNYSPSPS